MLYLPKGLRSASSGTRSPIVLKSSIVRSTSAECAIASRCRIKLVEPPSAKQVVIAFSKALRVIMSRGLRSSSSSLSTAAPAFSQSLRFGWPIATCAELPGRLIPSASIALAIVLAVYMPPHEPAPGMAYFSTSLSSSSVSSPLACLPTASNTETISIGLRCSSSSCGIRPGKIVPPYTNTAGRLRRARAIMQPGIFLSQPPMATRPSKPSAATTVSIESAITSRETRL